MKINNKEWAGGRENKTRSYMAETGVNEQDIRNVICELEINNYSYTEEDRNENFPNQEVWVFGITK